MRTDFVLNAQYATTDQVFRKACELAGTPPTQRQASKFRNERGKAYLFRQSAINELAREQEESNG